MITSVDYRLNGYHKKNTFDSKGDLVTVEYYKNFDGTAYSDIKVKETRTFTRDVGTGLLTRRDMVIEWLRELEEEVSPEEGLLRVLATKNTVKFYESQKGYSNNKRARTNLVDKASMYLYSQVSEADSKQFLRDVKSDVGGYIAGDLQPLLDAINDSTEPYMTGTIKATLDAILNINY